MLAVGLNARSLLLVTSLQDLARLGHQEGTMVRHQERVRHQEMGTQQERGRKRLVKDVSMCGGHCVEGRIGGFLRYNLV